MDGIYWSYRHRTHIISQGEIMSALNETLEDWGLSINAIIWIVALGILLKKVFD